MLLAVRAENLGLWGRHCEAGQGSRLLLHIPAVTVGDRFSRKMCDGVLSAENYVSRIPIFALLQARLASFDCIKYGRVISQATKSHVGESGGVLPRRVRIGLCGFEAAWRCHEAMAVSSAAGIAGSILY